MKKGFNKGSGGKDPPGEESVTLRRHEPATPSKSLSAPSPYAFMRRSCTFVAESSLGLRKSSSSSRNSQSSTGRSSLNSSTSANKVVKDRKNLAMQVRQKKELLEESTDGGVHVNCSGNGYPVNGSSGRVSKFVGGLRAWSSTEDVRQSFMGAIGRTVSVMKQRPVTRRVKQVFGRTEPTKPEPKPNKSTSNKSDSARIITAKVDSNNVPQKHNNKGRNAPVKSQPLKSQPGKPATIKVSSVKPQQGKQSPGNSQLGKSQTGRPKSSPPEGPTATAKDARWFRHIQEAQEAYTARDGRNRRSHPPTPLPDPDDQAPAAADAIRDVDDGDDDGGEMTEGTNDIAGETKLQTGGVSNSPEQTGKSDEWSSSTTTPAAASQTPGSPDTLSKKTEHLRRKDIKIRQALEEKQHIIADILNIPHEHFENVADMAGEPAVGNKEPRELVLAAMFQAKCLQETLNEALNIGEGDIIAARTNNDAANKASSLPLYQAPMTKLMNISTALSQQLSSLLNLVSERDDERERMRKELVASRERLHLFHMRQNSISSQPLSTATVASVTPPTATSPHTSRPSSFVSVSSSAADHSDTPDHHDTDEEGRNEVPKISSMPLEESGDPKEESILEAFEDAVSGSESTEIPPHDSEPPAGREDCGEETSSDRGCEINTETSTT